MPSVVAAQPVPRPGAQGRSGRTHRLDGSRPHRNCTHQGTSHRHGTRIAYVKDSCRCPDCTAANAATSRARYRQQALGQWHPFTHAAPVREHLVALRAAGVGVERIAQLTGLSLSHVRALASAHAWTTIKVRQDTAARILAVTANPSTRASRSQVPALGTRRRLQALPRLGWPLESIAQQLGRRPASLRRSMAGATVTAHTARTVAELYSRLEGTAPPEQTAEQRNAAAAVRQEAVLRSWPPPLAWDDIDKDPSPTNAPPATSDSDLDPIAIERAIAGDGVTYDQLTPAEQQSAIALLTDRGHSIRAIAAQLHTTKRTVSRRRSERTAPSMPAGRTRTVAAASAAARGRRRAKCPACRSGQHPPGGHRCAP